MSSLPEYNPNSVCPKCGNEQVRTIYGNNGSLNLVNHYDGERLLRTCCRCAYSWNEGVVTTDCDSDDCYEQCHSDDHFSCEGCLDDCCNSDESLDNCCNSDESLDNCCSSYDKLYKACCATLDWLDSDVGFLTMSELHQKVSEAIKSADEED
jgi:hypothetical protein